MNIFENASRRKLRFTTSKGTVSTEELWDLSLQALDTLAKGVNKTLKDSQEESFLTPKSTGDTESELRLEILKHVISEKQIAAEKAKLRAERSEKAARIRSILANKADEALAAASMDELQKQLAELEA